jgi:hypothetical protein
MIRSNKLRLLKPLLVALATAGACGATTLPPIWETAFGNPVISSNLVRDDAAVNLGFNFSLFGASYSSASVSSKGYVTFGGAAGAQATPNSPQFLQGIPRIAPAWYDVDVQDSNGTILFNSFQNRAVFTFLDVASYAPPPGMAVLAQNLATYQLMVYNDGTVVFGYAAFNSLDPAVTGHVNSLLGSPEAIIGISPGFGGSDPGSVNLPAAIRSAAGFAYTTANSAVYQVVDNGGNVGPDNTSLAGVNFIFTPGHVSGWTVTTPSQAATAVVTPEPATAPLLALGLAALVLCRNRKMHV